MALSEGQIELLKTFTPVEKLIEEINRSNEFCDYAEGATHSAPSLNVKYAIVKAIIERGDISFIQPVSLAHNIIEISKEDRQKGFELLFTLLNKFDQLDYHESYLCSELGPVDETEITKIFSAFEESDRPAYTVEAMYFLSKICEKNYLPLFGCLKEWLKDPKKSDFGISLCREISKALFDSKENRVKEKKQFVEMLVTDLNEKGIMVSNQFNPSMTKHTYAEYIDDLLIQYQLSEYHQDRICQGYTNHKEIFSLLPQLQKQFEEGRF